MDGVCLRSSLFVEYGVSMFAVLFGSWISYIGAFELLERFQFLPAVGVKRCQLRWPPQSQNPVLRARAWKMVQVNWSIIFALSLAGAPVMQRLFPNHANYSYVFSESPQRIAQYLCALCAQVTLAFLIDDFWFYCYHRLLHENSKLYVRFHKPHHAFTQPFSWTSHATHPVEMLLQSVGGVGGPLIAGLVFSFFIESGSAFTRNEFYFWLALRQLTGVIDHCGFNVGGEAGHAKFHDLHHEHFSCNYASFFQGYDRLFGTDFDTWRQSKPRMLAPREHSATASEPKIE